VVSIPVCIPRGTGIDFRRYKIFCVAVGLEWDPLSLVRIDELLERKVAAPVYRSEINGHGVSAALTTQYTSIHASWH
jgi:hypothetical protein